MSNRIIVIGAGPAGLTSAYELLKSKRGMDVVILEETGDIGGISKTVNYKGNRMDMGGASFLFQGSGSQCMVGVHDASTGGTAH